VVPIHANDRSGLLLCFQADRELRQSEFTRKAEVQKKKKKKKKKKKIELIVIIRSNNPIGQVSPAN
jgi:uracil phosphoribosyltransferase